MVPFGNEVIKVIWQNTQHFHVIALPAFEWVILSKLSQHHKTRCFPMKLLEEIGVKFWLIGVRGGNLKTGLKAITLANRPFCTRLCCKHSIQGCQISQHIDFIHDQNTHFRFRESSYHSVEVFGSSLSSPSKSWSWSVGQHWSMLFSESCRGRFLVIYTHRTNEPHK